MTHGSARSIVAVVLVVTALTLAEEDAGYRNAPASMIPPVPFPTSAFTTTTTAPQNTTIANKTTVAPTTHHTTTTNVTTPAPTTHHTTTTNVTTPAPTTHHTTTANVTTVAPTTHNSTTANVTTVSPTTHHPTTVNVTTVAPNTTTPNPTTKPLPTPTTNVTVGNYTVIVGNKLCVMVQASIKVKINKSQKKEDVYIVPGDAKSNGTCVGNTASLKINLKEGYISMDFIKNDTSDVVYVSAVAVNLSYAFTPEKLTRLYRQSGKVQLFSVKTGHSYSCKSESVLLGNDTFLEFTKERMQAFNITKSEFGKPDLCKADQTDYRVAIGVLVVLIILIVIVVVAYLISRRRRTAGYQTL